MWPSSPPKPCAPRNSSPSTMMPGADTRARPRRRGSRAARAPGALPELRERAEVRLVLGPQRERAARRAARASSSGTDDVGPAEVRGDQQPAVAVDQPGQRDDGAGGQQAARPRRARERLARRGRRDRRAPRRPAGHGCRRRPARGGARRRARSSARTARKSTPISSPSPTTRAPAQLHRQRRAPDRAAQLELRLAHQPELDQLADQARHGRLVEPGLLRDRGARARTAVGHVAQHDAEVVAAHGALVGGCCESSRVTHPTGSGRRAAADLRVVRALVGAGRRGAVERRDRARLRRPRPRGRTDAAARRARRPRSPRARTRTGRPAAISITSAPPGRRSSIRGVARVPRVGAGTASRRRRSPRARTARPCRARSRSCPSTPPANASVPVKRTSTPSPPSPGARSRAPARRRAAASR